MTAGARRWIPPRTGAKNRPGIDEAELRTAEKTEVGGETEPGKVERAEIGTVEETELRKADEAERRARTTQSFWTVAVGVPAIISILRLVVEAGGELQTTLLLVANVNPVNLVAAFVITSTRMVSALLVLLFAISAVLATSVPPGLRRADRDRRPLVVRWKSAAPMWFVIVVIVVALATWQILYLPLLLLALVAMFQLSPFQPSPARRRRRWLVGAGVVVLLLGPYVWLLHPTVIDAARQREYLVIALLVAPAFLALAITGPIHRLAVRPLATFGPLIMLVAMLWTAYSVVTTPVLPTTVTTIATSPAPTPGRADPGPLIPPTQEIHGHVITVDDVHMLILQEHGGVRYVPVDVIRGQVLCPDEEKLPRYRLWVRGFHVEESILEGLGRRERPIGPPDAACRIVS